MSKTTIVLLNIHTTSNATAFKTWTALLQQQLCGTVTPRTQTSTSLNCSANLTTQNVLSTPSTSNQRTMLRRSIQRTSRARGPSKLLSSFPATKRTYSNAHRVSQYDTPHVEQVKHTDSIYPDPKEFLGKDPIESIASNGRGRIDQ